MIAASVFTTVDLWYLHRMRHESDTTTPHRSHRAERRTVTVYSDYKSPYAYLAKDLAYELERDFPIRVDWLPYTLDIPSFLGSARIDDDGRVIEEQRNAHQWRRTIQLHGLPSPGSQARARHPRPAKNLGLDHCFLRHALRQASG